MKFDPSGSGSPGAGNAEAFQNENAYRALKEKLFGGPMKSHAFERRFAQFMNVVTEQAGSTPGYIGSEREGFVQAARGLLNCYFMTPPLPDDPLGHDNRTRLDILCTSAVGEQPASDTDPDFERYQGALRNQSSLARQAFADMRAFAEVSVDRAIAQGIARSQSPAA